MRSIKDTILEYEYADAEKNNKIAPEPNNAGGNEKTVTKYYDKFIEMRWICIIV
jgi:hypothetical protein